MKKYWKARAASRLTRYSISQINICQGLFSLAVLFFDTQRTSFWVLGLLLPAPSGCTCFLFFVLSIYIFLFFCRGKSCQQRKLLLGAWKTSLHALWPSGTCWMHCSRCTACPALRQRPSWRWLPRPRRRWCAFFRRAERECAVKLPRAKSAPASP